MALRDAINKYSGVVSGVLVLAIVACLYLTYRSATGGPTPPFVDYFTVDDGATWFAGKGDQIAPFDYGGKTAVQAHVFRCPDGKEFVGYLESNSEEGKRIIGVVRGGNAGEHPEVTPQSLMTVQGGKAFKRPGEKDWTPAADAARVNQIKDVRCEDGSSPVELGV